MRRRINSSRSKSEPTLPLINIVFLMLIFFLVAAQLSRPLETDLELVRTDDPDLIPPPDALILMQDGQLMFRGHEAVPEDVIATLRADTVAAVGLTLRLLPDQRAKAHDVMETASALRSAGAEAVYIVTQRALK